MPYKLSILFLFSFFWSTIRALDYYHMADKSDGPTDPILKLAISETNSIIISAHSAEFNIYQKSSITNLYTLHSTPAIPIGNIVSLDLTSDGQIVAIGLDTNAVIIYELNGLLGVTLIQTLTQATDIITSVCFSKDQTLLLSGSKDSKARLYTLHDGSYVISRVLNDAAATSYITAALISQNNSYLYTADSTGKIRIYIKSATGYNLHQTIAFSAVKVNGLAASNDSQILTACSQDGIIKVFRMTKITETFKNYQELQYFDPTTDPLVSISISSDLRIIASSPTTSTIWVYQAGAYGFYSLILSNLTGAISKLSTDGTIILGTSNQILKIYHSCSIANCKLCTSRTFCTQCSAGFYAASDGTCGVCSSNCSRCSGTATDCTSCIDGFFVHNPSHICMPCVAGCRRCSPAATCSACYDKFYLSGTSCLNCRVNCSTCSNYTDCTHCAIDYYNSSGTCLPCVWPCNHCHNITVCRGCVNTHYLQNNSCLPCQSPCITCTQLYVCSTCIVGYYTGYSTVNCWRCKNQCLACTSQDICSACNPVFTNVYHNGTTCVYCPYNCSSCTNPSTCTVCSPGFYLNGLSCPKCNSSCTTCTSATVCTSCSPQYTLSSGRCINCPSNCLVCSNSTTCTTCKKNYYLQNSQCVSCSMPGCIYCMSLNECLLCEGGYSLVNLKCMSFQTPTDPYAYVKEISMTRNQTLSLIITTIVLVAIFSLAFAVYYWIIKPYDQAEEAEGEVRNEGEQTQGDRDHKREESQNLGENRNQNQEHNRSDTNLFGNSNLRPQSIP